MRSPRAVRALTFVALIVWGATPTAQVAGPPSQAKAAVASALPPPVATPLEQAVIEHACRLPGQAMRTADAYESCLASQLDGLRAEFGRDLKKLSAGERRTIDRACTALRTERGRDAYVACLDDRLTALVAGRGRTRPAVSLAAPPPVTPIELAPIPAASPEVPVQADAPTSSGMRWVGLFLVLLGAAGVAAWWKSRQRPAIALCRVCGQLAQSGDLCAACRHEAAETQRRAVAERGAVQVTGHHAAIAHSDAHDSISPERDGHQREVEQVDLDERRLALERADALRVQQEQEREAVRRRQAEHREWQAAAASVIADEEAFDAHAVLRIAADATPEQIRAAYDEARQKYAPEQVAHLGIELQNHYRKRAEAVERAFELLNSTVQA